MNTVNTNNDIGNTDISTIGSTITGAVSNLDSDKASRNWVRYSSKKGTASSSISGSDYNELYFYIQVNGDNMRSVSMSIPKVVITERDAGTTIRLRNSLCIVSGADNGVVAIDIKNTQRDGSCDINLQYAFFGNENQTTNSYLIIYTR